MTTPKLLNAGPSERGSHRIESMLKCPQLYAYRYVLDVPEARLSNAVLARGSLVHIGLAHHYARVRAIQQQTDPEEFFPVDEAISLAAVELEASPDVVTEARALVTEHIDHHALADLDWTILEVEEEHRVTVRGHLYTARFDLVVKAGDGRIYIVDHKTAARIDSRTRMRYALAIQFIGAQAIGRATWGEAFGGCILNLIGRTPVTFVRERLRPAPGMLREFPRIVADAEDRIEALTASGRDPKSWPRAASETVCMSSYGPCSCFELCQWGLVK